MLYFGIASLWGFLVGSATIIIGLSIVGKPIQLGSVGTAMLMCAGVLALLGGVISSFAYREAARRHMN